MRSCFFRPIWSTKPRTVLGQSRTRAEAADLHDRLIGFKAEERGEREGGIRGGRPFSRLRKENGVEWHGSGFITLPPSAPCSAATDCCIAFLKVCRFSHLVAAAAAAAAVWTVSMVSTSKFKTSGILFLFSSSSGSPNAAADDASAKQSEERGEKGLPLRRPLSTLSLSPFFSSVYFCPFRNFPSQTKRENKTVGGSSFTSILIIVVVDRERCGTAELLSYENRARTEAASRYTATVCRPILPFQPQAPESESRNALANRD